LRAGSEDHFRYADFAGLIFDRGPLPDQIRDIDGCFAACGIPQCFEASSQRERFERLAQDFTTDPIDDNVAFIRAWFTA
jgi:hypothetical protein